VWAKNTLYGVGGTKEKPTKAATGRQYVNVLLGDFTDSTFAWYSGRQRLASNPYGPFPYGSSAADDQAANLRWFNFLTIGDSISPFSPDSSIVGSLSNFYFDFTYKKCWWYGTVAYGSGGRTRTASRSGTAPATAYLQAVITACDATVNYYQGGAMNNLIVVHPGPGQEESGDTGDIWSMSMTGLALTSGEGSISRCIACPQNAQLGVFAHELFHQVGGPDLYDYGYSGTPYGEWSLMDNGSWNGIVEGGDSPAFPGALLTYDINGYIHTGIDGWLTQTDSISSARLGDGEYTIAALDSAGEARRSNVTTGTRLWRIRNNTFRDSGQTFFVELRNRTPPYERGLSENGLIITHIDTRMSGGSRFNDGPPTVKYYYAWVEQPGFNPNLNYAAGDSTFPRTPSNAAYSANDISGGGYTENAIDSLTIPNCKSNRGALNGAGVGNGPWIYDISSEGPTMTFKVARTGFAISNPLVAYNAATVKDPLIGGMANNNNSMLDPWEEDSIIVNLRNNGTAITAGAACSLYVVDGGAGNWATVKTPGWVTVGGGAIPLDGSGVSLATTINISKDVPKFTDIVFGYKFRSTTPAYTTDGQFTLRVSGFNIVKVYDFVNVAPQGTSGFANRIQPADIAIYKDTMYVANAQLNLAAWGTRIHKVKLNTTNNPLLTSDTVGSLNNMVSSHNVNKYLGGIDVDNSGKLWWTCQDSVFGSNRNNVRINSFRAPNVSWGGTPMKRVRGLGIGPLTIDTVGVDCMPGDSVMLYFQNYYDAAAAGSGAESLWVTSRVTGVGLGVRTKAWAFQDSAWGATSYGGANGYSWWNGRALDYDGSNVWTSSVWMNILMRRNVTISGTTAPIIETMPGPSSYGVYGTYGMALESTDSLGVQYAPAGTVTYVRGLKGTRHYMYCASMDEGKVYKVDITGWMLPTPPDSMKVVDTGSDNVITWWKSNVDVQKIPQYIVYRQAPGATTPPTAADELARVQHVYGAGISNSYTDVGGGTKAAYVYSVKSVNFYGEGSWGASVNASPLAIEDVNFTSAPVINGVTLEWATVSGYNSYKWLIKRSTDDQDYQVIATVPGSAPSPYGQKYSYTDQVETAGIYYYQLYDGNGTLKGKLSATVGKTPLNYELSQNCPNPVGRGSTKISYALKSPGKVSLVVYNVLGEQVRTLDNGTRPAGFYDVSWNGADDHGQQVSNGIYFYKLISGNFQSTKKLTVLK
jgi:M6 family metalloprotease-like protein